jgi:hypothetical protein
VRPAILRFAGTPTTELQARANAHRNQPAASSIITLRITSLRDNYMAEVDFHIALSRDNIA